MTARKASRTTSGRGRLFESVLETIGDTPAIRINNLGVDGRTIYVKAEFFNPASSVKDRLAVAIIEEGKRSGALMPGQHGAAGADAGRRAVAAGVAARACMRWGRAW